MKKNKNSINQTTCLQHFLMLYLTPHVIYSATFSRCRLAYEEGSITSPAAGGLDILCYKVLDKVLLALHSLVKKGKNRHHDNTH